MIIIIAIFFALAIIVKSYIHIDGHEIKKSDIIKAAIPAFVALSCLIFRGTYLALPEETTVSTQFLYYRQYLLWIFLALMAYIIRFMIYGAVYLYRRKKFLW